MDPGGAGVINGVCDALGGLEFPLPACPALPCPGCCPPPCCGPCLPIGGKPGAGPKFGDGMENPYEAPPAPLPFLIEPLALDPGAPGILREEEGPEAVEFGLLGLLPIRGLLGSRFVSGGHSPPADPPPCPPLALVS